MGARLLLLMVLAGMAPASAWAQEDKSPAEDAAHEQLRTLRRQMVEAINKSDVEALLTHLDKNVVVTWMDGRVSRGPQEVREYIEKMTKGPDRKVESYKTDAEVDELTHLYGDTGVATGHSRDEFVLTDGKEFVVDSRWTATLVRENGTWKVAGFHASAGLFDNPVLSIAVRRTALWAGGIAGLVALVIGLALGWFVGRRGQPGKATPPS